MCDGQKSCIISTALMTIYVILFYLRVIVYLGVVLFIGLLFRFIYVVI